MIWRMLLSARDEAPDRVLFSEGESDLRLDALVSRASAAAAVLAAAGVGPGDVVGVVVRRGLRLVTSLFGVLGAGGVAAPLNPESRAGELTRALAPCRPRLVLCEPEVIGTVAPLFPEVISLDEVLPEAPRAVRTAEPPFDPDRGAFILFSTGSTGFPKRVTRTHRMMRAEADQVQAAMGLGPGDVILGIPPIYHSYGLCCVMLSAVRSGARARLFPSFQPDALMAAVARERATVMPASPYHYSLLASMTPRAGADLSSLRWCVSCGAPAPAAVIAGFRERFGLHVRQLYGASEAGSVSLNRAPDPSAASLSCGTPLPGVRVRIVGEGGADAAAGQTGEVAVSSAAVSSHYDDLPEMTAQCFRDGWFLSGDLGRLDEQGNLYVTGRVKLHINAGGNKVDPLEVEAVLEQHVDVAEAAVVGAPAAHGLEVVKAVVVLRPGAEARAEDLRAFCVERLIGYKVPRIVEFRETLPRSPSGKLLRKDLMEAT